MIPMSNENTQERDQYEKPDRLVSPQTKERIITWSRNVLLVVVLSYLAFPLYWLIVSSIMPRGELLSQGVNVIPTSVSSANIVALLTETKFLQFFINSTVVAIGATVLSVVLALLGGYGLARSNFRGRRNLARVILFTYMFPHIVIGIPLYSMFYNMGLISTYPGLIIAHTAIALPFCLWLMWQFFQTIPIAFEESAWIAGASRKRAFRDVVLPMSVPGVIAVSIFAFAVSWSDYTLATIIMTDSQMHTLPVGIDQFIDDARTHWGMLNAAGFLVMVPAFLLVYFLQKYILVGFTIGE